MFLASTKLISVLHNHEISYILIQIQRKAERKSHQRSWKKCKQTGRKKQMIKGSLVQKR